MKQAGRQDIEGCTCYVVQMLVTGTQLFDSRFQDHIC